MDINAFYSKVVSILMKNGASEHDVQLLNIDMIKTAILNGFTPDDLAWVILAEL